MSGRSGTSGRPLVLGALALSLPLLGGCGRGPGPDVVQAWLTQEPDARPPCEGVADPPAGAAAQERPLVLWLGKDVPNTHAQRALGELAAVWGPLGVHFVVTERALLVADEPLVVRANPRPTSPGAPPDAPPAADAVSRAVAPLGALLRRLPEEGPLHVVVLSRLVAPDAEVLAWLGSLDGLAFAAKPGAAPGDSPGDALATYLPPRQHAPVALVAASPEVADTLAHEVGHALGLSHHRDRFNLMAPHRPGTCRPGLDQAQREALGVP